MAAEPHDHVVPGRAVQDLVGVRPGDRGGLAQARLDCMSGRGHEEQEDQAEPDRGRDRFDADP
jgi:hypothetical protein